MYLNKAIIIGNMTRDPELKSLPSGMKVTSFSLATNRVYKDREGARKEETDFHNVVVFGRQAETSAQYLKKGQSVMVEGRIQTRSWDAQDGTKKYRTEIVADRVQFGPKAAGGGQSNASEPKDNSAESAPAEKEGIDYPEEEANPDDIPF